MGDAGNSLEGLPRMIHPEAKLTISKNKKRGIRIKVFLVVSAAMRWEL
jgi:hypothetical protein